MHSLYFPMTWKEAVVTSPNLMMFSGQIKDLVEAEICHRALVGPTSDQEQAPVPAAETRRLH